MKSDAPIRTSPWARQHSTVPDQLFGFVRAVAVEYARAAAAASRYEQLRRTPRDSDDPDAHPARRTYREFYAGR